MKTFFFSIILLLAAVASARGTQPQPAATGALGAAHARIALRGRVTDGRGHPVVFASVTIKNTLEGASTDSAGYFSLETEQKGPLVLVVTAIGFKDLEVTVTPGADTIELRMTSVAKDLGEVVITAGTIEATDDRLLTVLKPVDLMSNAGSTGDIVGAVQNLPGVQRNGGDQTGLFVRGGDASETVVVVDGATQQNAFFSDVPGVGQRSRFTPFQLKGTSFSTGGYPARYGQALSSVLALQTTDLPDTTSVSLSANVAGLILSGALRNGNDGLEYFLNYTDFGPYYGLSKTNDAFFAKPVYAGVTTKWASKAADGGLYKVNFSYGTSHTGADVPDPDDYGRLVSYNLHNENFDLYNSYARPLSGRWRLLTDLGYSNNEDNILWNDTPFLRYDHRVQARVEATYQDRSHFRLTYGSEVQHFGYREQYDTLKGTFDETLLAGYTEAEYKPVRWLAVRPGFRAEYSALLGNADASPRMALAVRTGIHGQLGAATGLFYEEASANYLLFGYRPGFQEAIHYLVNYEWIRENRSFRLEAYYKRYRHLVREQGVPYTPNPYRTDFGTVDNTGYGFARGFDVFWRDKVSIPYIDYWITYSYVDTRRLYQNYLAEATPDFVSTHNLNLILKYLSANGHVFASAGYNYASGRPYYNPASATFFGDRASAYQNISGKVSYLATFHRVFAAFYVNVDDLTNYRNVLGYRYSADGAVKVPVLPPQNRSVLFGVYLSLTAFKKDDL
ncbi:TonB-dependent receptor [Dinghuibacter silviterrae]|uniref:TonB-dependent receptor-like protein n=1 Tax=Dinghuibacter silviterrae TaxID=1539049 RepID=A0A4R8DFN2_9BACT|nr:TonB-dependent receptor [Dinghuibacter silviterrae]TDW96401.1 TonB-dependent receptor-like protein [Dinghuibacter silviterrae]